MNRVNAAESHANRAELIREIGLLRDTTVISYVTSTRPNLDVPMSMDVVPILFEHLLSTGANKEKTKLDLFIHSNGGDGVVPWRIVQLFRQYCNEFSVLVPNHAYSAATLLALGADHVFMHPMGVLGPIDPTVTTPYNPPDPINPGRKLGVSVEDVAAYIALVREDVGIHHEDELVQAFLALANANVVHPLALGSVKRSTAQGRMLGQKLLKSRKLDSMEDHEIAEVVKTLTSELYYHGHPINWEEAQGELGLKFVQRADAELSDLMWKLFSAYADTFELSRAFDVNVEATRLNMLPDVPKPPNVMNPNGPTGGIDTRRFEVGPYPTVIVESVERVDFFEVKLDAVVRRDWTGKLEGLLAVSDQGWRTDANETEGRGDDSERTP